MQKQNFIPAILMLINLGSSLISKAQSDELVNPFKKGSVFITAGIGTGNEYNSNSYNSSFGVKTTAETGKWQVGPGVVSLGAEAGSSISSGGALENYKASTFVLAARSAWHHGWDTKGLDTYAGLSAGLGFNNYRFNKNEIVRQREVIPVFGAFIGASYFVGKNLGLNIEMGNNITRFQAGVVYKLR